MDLAKYGQWLRERLYGLQWKVQKTSSRLYARRPKLSIHAGLRELVDTKTDYNLFMSMIAPEPSVYKGSGANILIKVFFLF